MDPEKSKVYKEFTENIDKHMTDTQQYRYSKNDYYKKSYQHINNMLIDEFGKKIL
jgi:hypothetical protein